MNRRSFLTVLVLVAVFVAGALAGAVTVRFAGWGESSRVVEGDGSAQADGSDADWRSFDDDEHSVYEITSYLEDELGLDPEQEAQVLAILERRSAAARELFLESRQSFLEHLDSTIAEVRGVLDPEQAEEYERILEEFEYRDRLRDADG